MENNNNNDKLDDSLMHSDDDEEGNNVSATAPTTPTRLMGIHVHGSIYDDDMVEKYLDKEGKQRWKCKWCNMEYAGWNATKVIRHLNKVPGKDIRPCKVRIDDEHKRKYAA
jgi:hypothetical protein